MDVTERLIRKRNENKGKQTGTFQEEETMSYASWKRQEPLNRQAGAFHQGKLEGINSRKSIFDEKAIFDSTSTGP